MAAARLWQERCGGVVVQVEGAHEIKVIPFGLKNLLNGERGFGGGQPCGLAAAPIKYHRLAFRNSLH
jgi:hypothetical protein